MSINKFCNQQFQLRSFLLQHDVVSDFYLSSFQRNRSPTPLLIVRAVIFVGCLSIWIASMVLSALWYMPMKIWPIYLTHWGLVLNTIAAGAGLLVSILAMTKSPLETKSGLPWYVQVYWGMFNSATANAFFITLFYWALLTGVEQDFAVNLTLDIFIHAVNSVLMFALLASSRHPANFFHFYIPIGLSIIYLIFSYIYYISGGTDVLGNHAIYPMLDWKQPGLTIGIAVLCMVGTTILHGVVVALSACRDCFTNRCRKGSMAYDIHETY